MTGGFRSEEVQVLRCRATGCEVKGKMSVSQGGCSRLSTPCCAFLGSVVCVCMCVRLGGSCPRSLMQKMVNPVSPSSVPRRNQGSQLVGKLPLVVLCVAGLYCSLWKWGLA